MTGTIGAIKTGNDIANSKIATGAFNRIMVKFFGNHYIEYFVRKNVLEGVAEAEAKKQLEQFVNNPNPMLTFMQAESELEYKNMFGTLARTLPKIKNKIPKDEEVNLDIMKRLKDLSKDFSSDDMQEIVAGILAGEYNQPGTFSLRTMEVVRNLTKSDIELFQKFCGYVFDGKNFFADGYNLSSEDLPILRKAGIGYDEYLYLQDIGLVGNSRNFSREFGNKADNETEYEYLFSIQNQIIAFRRKGATTISGLGSLTRAGEELLTITGFQVNDKLKDLVVKHFNKFGFK